MSGPVDWGVRTTEILLNPRLPREAARELIVRARRGPEGLIWLATSGSTGAPRLVGHTREGLLASAAAVNRHLECGVGDVLANPLPTFHVGGLGVLARAHRCGARVVGHTDSGLPPAWDPAAFADLLAREGATLTSLVPTQVHDLVRLALAPPPGLRAVVVGGAALLPTLYASARKLGWPLLPSYGSTECASQVATAPLDSLAAPPDASPPDLHLLSHLEARQEGARLAFRGPSLFAARVDEGGVAHREGDWWVSPDRGTLEGGVVRVVGREEDYFKVGGEGLHLGPLQEQLALAAADRVDPGAAVLVPWEDPRRGAAVALVTAGLSPPEVAGLREAYDGRVIPPARIRLHFTLDSIPRTVLGKPDRVRLLARLRKL